VDGVLGQVKEGRLKPNDLDGLVEVSSDGIARVHRIFAALAEASSRTKNRLQIMVFDHADEMTWQGFRMFTSQSAGVVGRRLLRLIGYEPIAVPGEMSQSSNNPTPHERNGW